MINIKQRFINFKKLPKLAVALLAAFFIVGVGVVVYAATADITTSITQTMTVNVVDSTTLRSEITTSNAITNTGGTGPSGAKYTSASFTAFSDKRTAAISLRDNPGNSEQSVFTSTTSELTTARTNLVLLGNYTVLTNAINTYCSLSRPEGVSDANWNTFQNACSAGTTAKGVEYTSAQQSTIQQKADDIINAWTTVSNESAQTIQGADDDIADLAVACGNLDENDWTPNSWAASNIVAVCAEIANINANPSGYTLAQKQTMINTTYPTAYAALVARADFSALEQALIDANAYDQTLLTPNSASELQGLISMGSTVVVDYNLPQSDVDLATNDINGFIPRYKGDKDPLQDFYDNNCVSPVRPPTATDAQWNAFITACQNAKTVLDDTEADQTEVDNALADLQTAFDNLPPQDLCPSGQQWANSHCEDIPPTPDNNINGSSRGGSGDDAGIPDTKGDGDKLALINRNNNSFKFNLTTHNWFILAIIGIVFILLVVILLVIFTKKSKAGNGKLYFERGKFAKTLGISLIPFTILSGLAIYFGQALAANTCSSSNEVCILNTPLAGMRVNIDKQNTSQLTKSASSTVAVTTNSSSVGYKLKLKLAAAAATNLTYKGGTTTLTTSGDYIAKDYTGGAVTNNQTTTDISATITTAVATGVLTQNLTWTAASSYTLPVVNMGNFQDSGIKNICTNNMVVSQLGYAKDTLDNKTYLIRKMDDGNCWMIQNMRRGSESGTTTLTSANTNITSNFVLPQIAVNRSFEGCDSWQVYANCGANGPIDNDTGHVNATTEAMLSNTDYGYMYSYCVISAGTACIDKMADNTMPTTITSDICPKGWQLASKAQVDAITVRDQDTWELIARGGVHKGTPDTMNQGMALLIWGRDVNPGPSNKGYPFQWGADYGNSTLEGKYWGFRQFGLNMRCVLK